MKDPGYGRRTAKWEAGELAEVLAKRPERADLTAPSKPAYERVYGPQHLAEHEPGEDLGLPGTFPFTRGVQPTMYRGQLWTMRQYAGFSTPEESNRRFRYLLSQGTTGLSVAFDLPTQTGLDSDDPQALGEVGRVGVPVSTRDDMRTLFEGIPLDQVSTSMTINATGFILLALYIVEGERQGVPRAKLRGTLQNDILKEYIARGTYIFPPEPSMRLTADVIAYTAAEVPQFNPISISGYHIREAGSTAAQEIAFTLADGLAYVERVVARGLGIDEFAPRLSFFFNSQMDFLEEVAKFRAARRLWARLIKERYRPRNPDSMKLRFHVQTAGSALAAKEPEVNLARVTVQALAAVLGGCQSLHTNSFDEALGLPTADAARLALRTQQVIGYETRVTDTVDPLGGSYAIEAMTERLEAEARALLLKIEELGGMLAAIEEGWVQGEITRSAYEFQKDLESGRRTQVAVNKFKDAGAPPPAPGQRLDPALEAAQKSKLAAFRAGRDQAAVARALEGLGADARGDANLVPPTLAAVRAGATVGEICAELRKVFGTYRSESGL